VEVSIIPGSQIMITLADKRNVFARLFLTRTTGKN